MTADGSTANDDEQRDVGEEHWTPAERALLDAAVEFYGAAEGVIDFTGRERPLVRHDSAGFEAVRRAMGALEERVAEAHAAGMTPERIAQIARIEQETIALILERRDTAPSPNDG
ncbi:MAG TPA: hypothetical protein VFG31_07340 [Conexibacter sp.]|nr:hypothetical protein [Conexibacter sp.]